jgi:AmmeMemoRadiSam system protein A
MQSIVFAGFFPHPPIVVPEVGGRETDKVAATAAAMAELSERIKQSGARLLVVISPHGPSFRDAVAIFGTESLSGSLARFGAPQVNYNFPNALEAVQAIAAAAESAGQPVMVIDGKSARRYNIDSALDHGALVPLYFLSRAGIRMPLVHLTFSSGPPEEQYAFGTVLARALDSLEKPAAIVASGDLSHRITRGAPGGYSPAGKKFDEQLVRLIAELDVDAILDLDPELTEEAGECGYRSLLIALGALDGRRVRPEVLSYEAPFGVGYLVADLSPVAVREEREKEQESEQVKLARMALEEFVHSGKVIAPPADTPLRWVKAAAFVSLKSGGRLRGCIGTIEPTRDSLAEEIIENAISAGRHDPRFRPVTPEELPELVYSVDVLSEPEEVSGPGELDPACYGVIVQSDRKKGLLLPALEGVNTVEEQLAVVLRKAGIGPGENYRIFRFTVDRYR